MNGESCELCRFWLAPEPDRPVSPIEPMVDVQGRCRRRAPLPEKFSETRMNWPRSDADDWCGEYEPADLASRWWPRGS